MKKQKKLLVLFLYGLLSTAFAAETEPQPPQDCAPLQQQLATCRAERSTSCEPLRRQVQICTGNPCLYTPVPKFLEEGKCADPRFMEVYGPEEFEKQIGVLNEGFDALFLDNQANPDKVVSEGIEEVRWFHACLEYTCEQIIQDCAGNEGGNLKGSQAFLGQLSWCLDKSDRLLDIQLAKLDYITTGSQAFKERSLLEEYLAAIGERLAIYVHDRLVNLTSSFAKLERAINVLIKYPKR